MEPQTDFRDDDTGVTELLLGDGRFLIALTGAGLVAAGGFAIFLCVTGNLLPHDEAALGMNATKLAALGTPNLVRFMFHDRAAFGGAVVASGLLYLWLAAEPLRRREAWAWWTLALSGALGFLSFLCYLGHGYFDTWHGVATLSLLPLFVAGMVRARRGLIGDVGWCTLIPSKSFFRGERTRKISDSLLLLYGCGLISAGSGIMIIGMTGVFVKTDIAFIGMSQDSICGLSDRLVPVIAHDRAGFGGALVAVGSAVLPIVLHARRTRGFRQILVLSGLAGFGAAIGVHHAVGYTDVLHLAPAYAGLAIFTAAMLLRRNPVDVVRTA